jgi:rare lipoprotein A
MENPMKIKNYFFRLLAIAALTALASSGFAETERGKAAYYGDSLQGNKTASGEPYDKNAMTAAHRTAPFGTKVKVTYLKTGKTVEVTVNDRGPRKKGFIIDVSGAAAVELGLKEDGIGEVEIEYSE